MSHFSVKKVPATKSPSIASFISEPTLPKSINRLTFKEQLKNLKSLDEKDYKDHLSQLLSSFNFSSQLDTSSLKSNTSFKSLSPSIPSPKLPLPSINLPLARKERPPNGPSILHPISEDTTEIFPSQSQKLKLQPIAAIKNKVSKVAYISKPGKAQSSVKVFNQDRVKILNKIHNIKGQYMFTVIDGHGSQGHNISQFIKKTFTREIKQTFPVQPKPDIVKSTVIKALNTTVRELNASQHNLIFSGATLATVFICEGICVCGNIGACKAVIAQELGQWQAVEITADHTLNNPEERKRIASQNSRIVKSVDMYGFESEIFFTSNENVPGLSITRSFGDKIGKIVGMSSVPEVGFWEFGEADKFILIGTEAFWRILSPAEAVSVARTGWGNRSVDQVCENLILEAEKRMKNVTGYVEDLTIIAIFLN